VTTKGQMLSFDELDGSTATQMIRDKALAAVTAAGERGVTVDEATTAAFPDGKFSAGIVVSMRARINDLRCEGLVRDSGMLRPNRTREREQTVWVLGDDRHIVEGHRRRKLHKFPTEWLLDELRRRGVEVST